MPNLAYYAFEWSTPSSERLEVEQVYFNTLVVLQTACRVTLRSFLNNSEVVYAQKI